MSKQFDPYRAWLGIPSEQQPANHYRLLGIELFENDLDVISGAADKQTVHLKTFQTGQHVAVCQKLLNEVAAVRVCLLNPTKKAAYDARLREKLKKDAAQQSEYGGIEEIVGDHHKVKVVKKSGGKLAPWQLAVFGGGGVVALVVVVLMLTGVFSGKPSPQIAQQEQKTTAAEPKPETQKPVTPTLPPPVAKPPLLQPTPKVEQPPAKLVEAPKPPPKSEPSPPKPVEVKSEPKPEPKPEPRPATPTSQVITEQDKRHPVPTEEEQQKGLAVAKDVYGAEFKTAKTADQKRVLAEKILQNSSESKDDPVGQYVLLRLAKDIAVAGGELDLAMNAVEQIGSKYRVDPYQSNLEVLLTIAKHSSSLKQRTSLALRAFRLVPAAVACDDVGSAKKLCSMAQSTARQIRDRDLAQKTTACSKELNQIATAFAEAEPAIAKLKEAPNDPQANSVAGRYQCFVKGNWAQGLPLLAQGNDEKIKSVAASELDGGIGKELALADQWWAVSEALAGREADVVHLHAADLYRKALSQLAGLEKSRVEKRLAEVKTSVVLTAEGAAKLATLISSLPSGAISVLTFEPNTFVAQGNQIFVKDLSGKNNHGEVAGATMVDGKVGKGLGMQDGSKYAFPTPPMAGSPRTICLWVKDDKQPKLGRYSVFWWGDTFFVMHMKLGEAGNPCWWNNPLREVGEPDMQWHHHTLMYDGKEHRYYIDAKVTRKLEKPLDTGNAILTSGPTVMRGIIDEIAIFDRALSDEEVKQVYDLGVNGQNLARQGR